MPSPRFFVVGVYAPEGETYLLDGEPHSVAECRRMIRWQGWWTGGFNAAWHVCQPGERFGEMIDHASGEVLRISGRGARTVEAYARIANSIWPEG